MGLDGVPVTGDETRYYSVQQILLNLIRNASGSSTSQSGMSRILTIRTRALNQPMIIDVEDTGGSERDPEKPSKPSTAAGRIGNWARSLAARLRFHMENAGSRTKESNRRSI